MLYATAARLGWSARTTCHSESHSKRLATKLSAYRCRHARGFRHARVEGSESWKSAFYPGPMARVIIASLFPFAETFVAPALPCRPSMPRAHRENEAHPLKPIDILLFETGVKEVKVPGLAHRLLDRKESIGQASAIECLRGSKDGLVNAGTWIESQIQSKADVLAWSRRTSNSVHFGSLMVIASVKGAELSPDSWKLKARIVFKGANIRDECGMSVFAEPSSLEGINTTSVSDAIKAYVQSELKSPTHTYVMLPPELVPDDKKHIKDPCARLYKALYGHPLSSASWALHLDSILKGLGGQEFPNLPSVYFFPHLSLVCAVRLR